MERTVLIVDDPAAFRRLEIWLPGMRGLAIAEPPWVALSATRERHDFATRPGLPAGRLRPIDELSGASFAALPAPP